MLNAGYDLEEGRHYGFSRRIPGTLKLSRLTVEGRILIVHAKLVVNHELRPFMLERFNAAYNERGRRKPAHKHRCGHLERTASSDHTSPTPIRTYERPVAPDAPAPEYVSGLLASLPITNISVIKARDGTHQETLAEVSPN